MSLKKKNTYSCQEDIMSQKLKNHTYVSRRDHVPKKNKIKCCNIKCDLESMSGVSCEGDELSEL